MGIDEIITLIHIPQHLCSLAAQSVSFLAELSQRLETLLVDIIRTIGEQASIL